MRTDAADDLVLGVDGGGTKTLAWLATRQAPAESVNTQLFTIGRGTAGPSNPCAVGFHTATTAIYEAICDAFADAKRPVGQVAAACFSIAGTEPPEEKRKMEQWARDRSIAGQLRMSNDAEPILACIGGRGVALIAGTGSFALGRNQTGDRASVGGWGFRFGDEGSGYAIATAGIAAAFRSSDGRGPSTKLLPQLYVTFDVSTPRDLVSSLYEERMDRRRIADLAPLVLKAAEAGDRVSAGIRAAGARDLAAMVSALNAQLRLASPLSLAVAGGVLVGDEPLRNILLADLRRGGLSPQFTVVSDPVRGAVEIAQQLLRTP